MIFSSVIAVDAHLIRFDGSIAIRAGEHSVSNASSVNEDGESMTGYANSTSLLYMHDDVQQRTSTLRLLYASQRASSTAESVAR